MCSELDSQPADGISTPHSFVGNELCGFETVLQVLVCKLKILCVLPPKAVFLISLPLICRTVNQSLSWSLQFKEAVVIPLLKKTGLDAVSKTTVLCQTFSFSVLHQLCNNLCDNFQSAYSMETALLDVMNCPLGSADEGKVSVLTLLDFSAAFDAHAQLYDMFSIFGKALEWFSSCLSDIFILLV